MFEQHAYDGFDLQYVCVCVCGVCVCVCVCVRACVCDPLCQTVSNAFLTSSRAT